MEEQRGEPIERWTAKRRAALVLRILKGETSVAEAARQHGLTVGEIAGWQEQFPGKAADAFYDKRKAFFAERNVAEVQNLKVKEAIITKLEAQLKEPDFKVVKKLQQQWRECGDGLRDKGRELQKKFRTLCDQIYSAANEGTESSQGEIII